MKKLWLDRKEALFLLSEVAKGNVGPFDLEAGRYWLHSSPMFERGRYWATVWASPASRS